MNSGEQLWVGYQAINVYFFFLTVLPGKRAPLPACSTCNTTVWNVMFIDNIIGLLHR